MRRKGLLKIAGFGVMVLAVAAFIGATVAVIQEDLTGGVRDVERIHCSNADLSISSVSMEMPWVNVTLENTGQRGFSRVLVQAVRNGSVIGSTALEDFPVNGFETASLRVERRPDRVRAATPECPDVQHLKVI